MLSIISLLSTSQVALISLCLLARGTCLYSRCFSADICSKPACSNVCSALSARAGKSVICCGFTLCYVSICQLFLFVVLLFWAFIQYLLLTSFLGCLSHSTFYFFNLFLFITCFHTPPFSSLLSPAVFTSLHRSCFLHDVPQQGHCISVTMFHKTLQSSFFLSSSTDLG